MKSTFLALIILLLFPLACATYISPFFSPTPITQFSQPDVIENRKNYTKKTDFVAQVNQSRSGISDAFTGGYHPELREVTYDAELLTLSGDLEKELAIFYSQKDISMLDPCTKSNYLLALHTLDGKVIKPGEHFNLNAHLANLRGYCTGRGAKNFTFYGGVCGVASQLFRAGLTSPQVRIDKRWGHNEWYRRYYGTEVQGDDAAVYEWSKQFVLTNISDSPFLIKTLQRWDQTWLFLIAEPEAVQGKQVKIFKTRNSALAIDIDRKLYHRTDAEAIKCKNPTFQFFSPQMIDCSSEVQAEEFASQQFKSRYLKILDRSL